LVLRFERRTASAAGAAVDPGARSRTDAAYLYLKYYADDDARRNGARDFPDYPMPAREPPPFDRDRHLP